MVMKPVKYCTCLFLITLSSACFAQNKLNAKGQPFGYWKYDRATYGAAQDGYYKIVSLSQYDSIHFEPGEGGAVGRLEVNYKRSRASIVTYNYDNDSMSVNDSVWNVYDSATGKLALTTVYDKGVMLWSKEYDAKGDLLKYDYNNYDADSSVYLTYLDHRVFKKEFYPPGFANDKITQYYPYEHLHLSGAEPVFNLNFLNKPEEESTVKIVADTDVTITKFIASNNIKLLNKKGGDVNLPIVLGKGDTYTLTIQYSSTPATYNFYDTIAIKTKGSNFTYKIICTAWCAHVDRNNASTIQNIRLSISKDGYLFIKGCGSMTTFSISDEDGKTSNYAATDGNITAVGLKEFEPGIYTLDITMNDCNTEGGGINLKISE